MACHPIDVSFVIPTHERAALLFDTVKSVLAQTLQPREIIVVDNGIGDQAAATLAPFGDKVRLTKSSPHNKQTARNVGIGLASGEWIATLDDDDLLAPDYLSEMVKPMQDGRADIISSDHRKFRGDQHEAETNFEKVPAGYWKDIPQPMPGQTWSYIGKFPLDRLLRRVPVYPSTMIIRRKFALEIGGYDPRMLGIKAEDLEFLIRALNRGCLALVWKPLVQYRLHAGNDTASADGQAVGRWRIFEFARQNHPDLPSYFIEAMERDLPERRRRIYAAAHRLQDHATTRALEEVLQPRDWVEIYKQAYRKGDRSLMRSVVAMIPNEAWSAEMRARQFLAWIQQPVSRSLKGLISRQASR